MTARSFRPLLEGKTETHRKHVNSGLFNWRLVGDVRYKLIRGFDPKQKQQGGSVPRSTDAPLVLYDLEKDPLENQNFAESAPEVVARLEKLLPPPNTDPNFAKDNYSL
jgi:hypothetical protein